MMPAVERRVAISGHAWRDWEPEPMLQVLAGQLGITTLDYWPWNRGTLSVDEYRALLARYGVTLSVINVPGAHGRLGAPGQMVQAQEALVAAIDEAVALQAEYVQFYTGVPEWPEFLTVVKTLVRDLRPVLERAEAAGITLLLENNVDQRLEDRQGLNPSRRPEMVRATMEEASSPRLRLAYDPCNFHVAGYEDYPYAYDLLKPWIANVHLKDCARFSPLVHAEAMNHDHLFVDVLGGAFLPVPVGLGTLNWDGILHRLDQDGYAGWLTLDPFTSSDALIEWCTQSLAYLERHVEIRDAKHVPA